MSAPALIGVDWGTTNRRVYLIEHGLLVRTERDARGVTAVAPGGFAAEAEALRARFGDLPMICAGMVGSTLGWRLAPYVPAPAGLDTLAGQVLRIDERVAIVPGVAITRDGRGDVMRGEEVQLLGAVAAGLAPADALICQPGTHSKWAVMREGRIAEFTTAMTGEMFALLRRHSLLAAQLQASVTPGAAFLEGVNEARRRDLPAALFGIRAASLLGLRDDRDAAAFASGLLIGSDVVARLEHSAAPSIHILADPDLGALYAAAITAQGRHACMVDSQAAFVSGIVEIERLAS